MPTRNFDTTSPEPVTLDEAARRPTLNRLGDSANARQVGGDHYAKPIQHWDYVIAQNLGYFEGQITKYVSRWRDKNGLEDLHKARHFLDKLIEEVQAGNITS
ncbi:MAG: DUF3310 domain-containing protein [Desulfurellales bacterium]|nr:MAG: DUF3310 domain-containing protein [Desulfurellales bacterium]